MNCNCAGILFGDGQHDAGCPALVAEPTVGPAGLGSDQAEPTQLPVTKEDILAALRKLIRYKTTAYDCECPDYLYRRKRLLTSCKHMRLFKVLEPYLEATKIMPIRGLTTERQAMMPRNGKIKLGYKKKHSNGNEYPVAADHFVCPPEVREVFGDEPKNLTVVFPSTDPDVVAPAYYRAYHRTRGLVCKGDGETANRKMNPNKVFRGQDGRPEGPLPTRDDKEIELFTGLRCPGRECPFYIKGDCSESMNVQFMLPDVDGWGVWQIDSRSVHSIMNLHDSFRWLRLFGNFTGVPVTLSLIPKEVSPDGRLKTVYVMSLTAKGKLTDMVEAAKQPMWALPEGSRLDEVVPEPDENPDDLLDPPDGFAPEGVVPMPDEDDHSNAANLRRAQAGAREFQPEPPPDEYLEDANYETGEIPQEPEQRGMTFRDRINACETAADYTNLLRDVFDRFDPSEQKTTMMDRITAAAEAAGFITDREGVRYVDPEPEGPPSEVEGTLSEGEAVDHAEEVDEDEDRETLVCIECGDEYDKDLINDDGVCLAVCAAPVPSNEPVEPPGEPAQAERPIMVRCAGDCGEMVEESQVNNAGVCGLCVIQGNAEAGNSPQPEPAGATLL